MTRCFFSLLLLLTVPWPGLAKGTKYALLIGVGKYDRTQLTSLRFPERDVTRLAEVLVTNAGFPRKNVRLLTQTYAIESRNLKWVPNAKSVRRELRLLTRRAQKDDVVLIAFAGHGVQFGGEKENYFCPSDADLSKKSSLIGVKSEVYQQLDQHCAARVKLLFVDACRNDPRSRINRTTRQVDLKKINNPQGLELPKGIAAFFSCKAGQEAYEDGDLKHGIFFHFVIEGLRGKAANKGKVTLSGLKEFVRNAVIEYVDEKLDQVQTPDLREASNDVIVLSQPMHRELEESFTWKGIKRKRQILRLDLGKGVTLDLVRIKKGTFKMGSPESDKQAYQDEKPQHQVDLKSDYFIGKCEITKGQFARFVEETGYKTEPEQDGRGAYGDDASRKQFIKDKKWSWKNVGFRQTDSHPVVCLTWNDALAFCKWLSQRTGKSIGLPTEPQWEYACRGGETGRYFTGDDPESLKGYANISKSQIKFDDGHQFSAPVGSFSPNGFGLHDMIGNVREWCHNYDAGRIGARPVNPNERVFRGGAWYDDPGYCRCAFRGLKYTIDFRDVLLGFRVISPADKSSR